MVAAVFAMQGVGILSAALVTVITLAGFQNLIREDPMYIDYVWRICLGFGAIPAFFTIYFRLTMAESPRYTAHVLNDVEKAHNDVIKTLGTGSVAVSEKLTTSQSLVPLTSIVSDSSFVSLPSVGSPSLLLGSLPPAFLPTSPPKARSERSWVDFKRHFSIWNNFRVLLGCSMSWFLLDIAFYGLNLNQSIVLVAIGFGETSKSRTNPDLIFEDLWSKALGNLVISTLGTVPGYWASVFTIEKLGRKFIQYMGFAILSVTLLLLSIFFDSIIETSITLFVVLYTVMQVRILKRESLLLVLLFHF